MIQLFLFLFSEFKLVFPNLVDTNGQVVSNRIQDLGTLRPFVYPKFKAFGKNFTLYLNQNHRLLGSEFVIEKITRSVEAEDVFSKSVGRMENEASCHYVGTVKGHANSSVAVNTCNGLVCFLTDASSFIFLGEYDLISPSFALHL